MSSPPHLQDSAHDALSSPFLASLPSVPACRVLARLGSLCRSSPLKVTFLIGVEEIWLTAEVHRSFCLSVPSLLASSSPLAPDTVDGESDRPDCAFAPEVTAIFWSLNNSYFFRSGGPLLLLGFLSSSKTKVKRAFPDPEKRIKAFLCIVYNKLVKPIMPSSENKVRERSWLQITYVPSLRSVCWG